MVALKRPLELWMIFSMTTLLIVWALSHTIAARNIALFSGVAAALVWLYIEKPLIHWRATLPAIFLLCVPLWVIFHYQFISTLREQQWDEIDSTWLRTTFSIILGFCTGLIIHKRPNYFLFFMIGIIILPCITTVLYFFQVDQQNKWILDGFLGVFKGKFSGVYFVTCQILVGFACLSVSFFTSHPLKRIIFGMGLLGSLLIISGIIDGIAFRALNLILIASFSALIFMIVVLITLIYQIVKKRMKWLPIISCVVISTTLTATLYNYYLYDKQHEQKLVNLISDIKVSTQLEKNQTWIRDSQSIPWPVDATGKAINGSTYERVSWFIRGIQFIGQNPWGNGITHMAFGYYMRDTYSGSKALMTHSGWVDFTLGIGLPGLLFIWTAILFSVLSCMSYLNQVFSKSAKNDSINEGKNTYSRKTKNSLKSVNQELIAYSGIWLLLGLAIFWIVGEVSEREYIEHYFFLISFFASVSSCVNLLMNKVNKVI